MRRQLACLLAGAAGLVLGAAVVRAQQGRPAEALSSPVRAYVLRLKPGQDLKREILEFTKRHGLASASVLTCVGSLRRSHLRFADRREGTVFTEKMEIVSLVGTAEPDGGHLHISLSDGKGQTIGGHLLDGNVIYTTAEIVLADLPAVSFGREPCPLSGFNELVVRPRPAR